MRRGPTPWQAFIAGLALGSVPLLLLAGARSLAPPLALVPLLVLAWQGTGYLVCRLLGLDAALPTRLGAGAGTLHTLLFLLGLAGGLKTLWAWILVAPLALLGVVTLAGALRTARRAASPLEGLCLGAWGVAAGLLMLLVIVPPMDPDAMTYHLALPQQWVAAGRFVQVPTLHYSYMPLGAEQGFLLARLLLGRAPLAPATAWGPAKGIALAYGLLLALATASLLDERGRVRGASAALAALMVFAVPATMLVSVLPYNDAYLSALVLLALGEGLRWVRRPSLRRAALAGLLIGFALGAKYTAILYAPLLVVALLLRRPRPPARAWVAGLLLAASAAVAAWSPWAVSTGVATGNPIYPLAWGTLDGAPGGATAWDAEAAARNSATAGHGAGLHPLRWISAPLRLWLAPLEFGVLPRVGPSLLVALPFLLWALSGRAGERARNLAAAALLLYLAWSLTARNARYLIPCLALLLALTAQGAIRVGASPRRFARVVVVGLVGALLAWDGVTAMGVFARLLRPGALLAGEESPQRYLLERRPVAGCLLWSSLHLEPADSLLLLGETRALYLHRRVLAAGPQDPSPLLWLERCSGADGFQQALERSRVACVVAVPSRIPELERTHDRYRGRGAEAAALVRRLEARGTVRYECGPGEVICLPRQPDPDYLSPGESGRRQSFSRGDWSCGTWTVAAPVEESPQPSTARTVTP